MSNYSRLWSSANPGYLIFLIDQSGSMNGQFEGGKTKAEFTAMVINRTIQDIINDNASGNEVKPRVFISLIGYGNSINDVRSDYLNEFAENPLRIEKVKKKVPDGAGGLVEIEEEMPVFLEPVADGLTPMADAFDFAKELIEGWVNKNPETPAPVIINVSDGAPYTGKNPNDNKEDIKETIQKANDILNISTSDGNVLIFNVHIGDGQEKIAFPVNESELNNNVMAELLFNISSAVPDSYRQNGQKFDLNINKNAKGFIANADATELTQFISFGSSGGDFRG